MYQPLQSGTDMCDLQMYEVSLMWEINMAHVAHTPGQSTVRFFKIAYHVLDVHDG